MCHALSHCLIEVLSIVALSHCSLVEHCDLNGSSPQDVVTMLGSGKLNSVIPQLWQRLSNVQDDALQGAIAEFSGSYTHKSKKAGELIA